MREFLNLVLALYSEASISLFLQVHDVFDLCYIIISYGYLHADFHE